VVGGWDGLHAVTDVHPVMGAEIRVVLARPGRNWIGVEGRRSLLNGSGILRLIMFAAIRFLWNATRGQRLTPWRSEYLKWRIETFSGTKAESLTGRDVLRFAWESRRELVEFLAWTGQVEREGRHRPPPAADPSLPL
jgi:hypothetical protein